MSAGFALTGDGDTDLNTLAEGEDSRVLAAAIVLALQTFLGEWRGNLRIGLDRAMFQLRDREDIRAALADGCRRTLRGLPLRILSLVIAENPDRVWQVTITGQATADGNPLEITVDLL